MSMWILSENSDRAKTARSLRIDLLEFDYSSLISMKSACQVWMNTCRV